MSRHDVSPALRFGLVEGTIRSTFPMFSSLVVELAHNGPVDVIGDHLHGWLLSVLANRFAALGDRLHAPERGKPFTVFLGAINPTDFNLGNDHPGSPATHWLRLTSVDAQLSSVLPEIADSIDVVSLGRYRLSKRRVLSLRDHPLVRLASGADLWSNWMAGSEPAGRVKLHFLSPTGFARGREGSTTVLPIGHLVFRSLLKTWNENVTPPVPDRIAAELLAIVQEEAHRLHTPPPVQFERSRLNGFAGECEYSCGPRASAESRRLLHLLTDFAFFAGVGLKRTMGMGQVVGEHLNLNPTPRRSHRTK